MKELCSISSLKKIPSIHPCSLILLERIYLLTLFNFTCGAWSFLLKGMWMWNWTAVVYTERKICSIHLSENITDVSGKYWQPLFLLELQGSFGHMGQYKLVQFVCLYVWKNSRMFFTTNSPVELGLFYLLIWFLEEGRLRQQVPSHGMEVGA